MKGEICIECFRTDGYHAMGCAQFDLTKAPVVPFADKTTNARAFELWGLHEKFVFGARFRAGSEEDLHFLALSLCGEVGELANEIKKEWRDPDDGRRHEKIAGELADVRILLELVSASLGLVKGTPVQGVNYFDLDRCVEQKLPELYDRLRKKGRL